MRLTVRKSSNNSDLHRSRPWSRAMLELLNCSAGVLRNNPRCACMCASIINRPCAEVISRGPHAENYNMLTLNLKIYQQLKEQNLLPIPVKQEEHADNSAAVKILKRKKTPAGYLPGYPADTDLSYVHEKRTDVRPCRHTGPCNSSCECVRTHVTCEKACACPPECPRKWRGCACKRGGRPCTTDKCVCVKANRECDPDLCGTCGSVELLDPMNRHNDNIGTNRDCQNVCLQRARPKKTLLGQSIVSGMGLYVSEDVERGEFIGEYRGEIVTNEEADRRGTLYDKRGISFLFTLNSAQAIDATRMGNKFRFINHSSKVPNCSAKVTMANCTHRIGFWTNLTCLWL